MCSYQIISGSRLATEPSPAFHHIIHRGYAKFTTGLRLCFDPFLRALTGICSFFKRYLVARNPRQNPHLNRETDGLPCAMIDSLIAKQLSVGLARGISTTTTARNFQSLIASTILYLIIERVRNRQQGFRNCLQKPFTMCSALVRTTTPRPCEVLSTAPSKRTILI
jgi:hypothetical protein